MNAAKAREHFSAYYEGSMDRGLCQAFEVRLETDAQIKAEYEAFVRTLDQLSQLSAEVPEPAFDLHERISARLDRHVFETERQQKPQVFQWWRTILLGSAAVAALVFAIVKGKSLTDESTQASMTSISTTMSRQIKVESNDNGLVVNISDQKSRTLELVSEAGQVLDHQVIPSNQLSKPLQNPNAAAQLVHVNITGGGKPDSTILIALPGSERHMDKEGSGQLTDLAKHLADYYGVPVAISVKDPNARLTWRFEGSDAMASAQDALKPAHLEADERSNVLVIEDN